MTLTWVAGRETIPAATKTSVVSENLLHCAQERQQLAAEFEVKASSCAREVERFNQCRSERPELKGIELLGCSAGLGAGLVTGELAEPWTMNQCGNDQALGWSCPVPACEAELETLKAQFATRRQALSC